MTQTMWITGLMFANLWATGNLGNQRNPEKAAAWAVPVQPWVADLPTEYRGNINDRTTPIRGPIRSGERPMCDEPPTHAEILAALPKPHVIPCIYAEWRDDVEFIMEKLVDRIDAPRFYPLVGPAQLHHCHWKCTVYFTETIEATYPFPMQTKRRRVQVVHIDKDFLHMCGSLNDQTDRLRGGLAGSYTRETPEPACAPTRVKAPDVLFIEAKNLTPRGTYKLEPKEVVRVHAISKMRFGGLRGEFMISPDGFVDLAHGSAKIAGLTLEQAQAAIADCLDVHVKNVTIELVQARGTQNIRGEHLIRPDGTVSLGMFGSVRVDGMSVGQVKTVVEDHLAQYFVGPRVSVDVLAYNSKKVYVIIDTDLGQTVQAVPMKGDLSVLEAVGPVLPRTLGTPRQVYVARPGKAQPIVLPVDWKEITQSGQARTNYQLQPGDRVYVSGSLQRPKAGHTEESSAPMPAPMANELVHRDQVQLEIVIGQMDEINLPRAEKVHIQVLPNADHLMQSLKNLRDIGKAKILAEPRVTTLSGRPAHVQTGGEKPVLTTNEQGLRHVSYEFFGTSVEVLPTLTRDGKIMLRADVVLSEPDSTKVAKAAVVQTVKSGETLVVTGDSLRLNGKYYVVLMTARTVTPTVCQPAPVNSMTLADVVRLAKRGISEDIIVRQMETMNATFRLSVDDILMLNEQGVSDNVIRAIQMRHGDGKTTTIPR